MDWNNMPPLAALRAFAAYADKGNLSLAGSALNVSHAAISQQLRALERHIGVSLVDRSGRSLALTGHGHRLARALDLGFGTIGTAIEELTGAGDNRPVHVSCTPTFAASWLMPRLSGFRAAHPEINLTLDPTPKLVAIRPGGIDLALRYGQGKWPGLDAEMLFATPIVIVAAPKLMQGKQQITPAELVNYPWLDELGANEASAWLKAQGVAPSARIGRTELPGNLMLDGLRAGQGVAATVRYFVQDDLNSGHLIELFCEYCETEIRGYHIVTQPGVMRPTARTFIRWLRQQGNKMDMNGE